MSSHKAKELRKNMTDAEQLIWSRLRKRQLFGFKFRRQHPTGRYIVDFICLEAKLVVEVDGGQHAENEPYDLTRSTVLESKGYSVLRFWNNDVLLKTDAVIQVISEALSGPPP